MEDEAERSDSDSTSTEEQRYTTSKQSIDDYFKEKYRAKLNKGKANEEESPRPVEEKKRKRSTSEKVEPTKESEIFSGSNVEELSGYEGWKISSSLDELKRNKEKSRKKTKKSS